MSVNLRVQRLYDRFELIPAVGDPTAGKACIMSFVALLAGEFFSDRPRTASQVIRKFAIPLNDRMDPADRQRLKPFAPRIIGTNDGRDDERARLVFETVTADVLPAALREHGAVAPASGGAAALREACMDLPTAFRSTAVNVIDGYAAGRFDLMAKEAGHLVAGLAEAAATPARRGRYIDAAIGLLDRLCDVGADEHAGAATRPPAVEPAA